MDKQHGVSSCPCRNIWSRPAGFSSWSSGNNIKFSVCRQETHCCCHLCQSWGKPAGQEEASAAGGACGSRSRSAPLSVYAAWRCWWSSRWRKIPDTPQDTRCWEKRETKRAENKRGEDRVWTCDLDFYCPNANLSPSHAHWIKDILNWIKRKTKHTLNESLNTVVHTKTQRKKRLKLNIFILFII